MPSGRPPDSRRRELVAKLRAKGWTFQAIADKLGVTRQSVHLMSQAMTGTRRGVLYKPPELRCARCATVIPRRGNNLHRATVLCLRCADAPGVAFGQRLRALRIAAGLTLAALGKRVGLSTTCIFLAEHDRHALRADTVEKLVSVLGTRLMKGIEQ